MATAASRPHGHGVPFERDNWHLQTGRTRADSRREAAQLEACPRDEPGGAWHELKGDLDGIWPGELSGNWRLLVEPDPLKSLSAVVVTVIDIDD